MIKHYILDENKNIIEATLLEWSSFFENGDRIVKQEDVGEFWVSTVFLGLDHGIIWHRDRKDYRPLLFETMITGAKDSESFFRTHTYQDALALHEKKVKVLMRFTRMKKCQSK